MAAGEDTAIAMAADALEATDEAEGRQRSDGDGGAPRIAMSSLQCNCEGRRGGRFHMEDDSMRNRGRGLRWRIIRGESVARDQIQDGSV